MYKDHPNFFLLQCKQMFVTQKPSVYGNEIQICKFLMDRHTPELLIGNSLNSETIKTSIKSFVKFTFLLDCNNPSSPNF